MSTIFLSALAGAVIGLSWGYAIGAELSGGFVIGFLVGAVVGLLIYLSQRYVSARFRIRKVKTYAVANTVIGYTLLTGIATAVLALVLRIFF